MVLPNRTETVTSWERQYKQSGCRWDHPFIVNDDDDYDDHEDHYHDDDDDHEDNDHHDDDDDHEYNDHDGGDDRDDIYPASWERQY